MLPNLAYDIEIEPRSADVVTLEQDHGWVFGLPRGIRTEEWPLDPVTGAPLMHGFTLLLPEQYRCHGPEIVGFSFFTTPADLNDGGVEEIDADFQEMILTTALTPEVTPAGWLEKLKSKFARKDPLDPYRRHAANTHPRLHRMTDILDYHYAVILLTADEINGPETSPPNLPMRDGAKPEWMTQGAAVNLESDADKNLGVVPEKRIDWNLAIKFVPRADDPNAGQSPVEDYGDSPISSGYVSPYDHDNEYALHAWAENHAAQHIGGTMHPVQSTPEMSPFYIEFEEYFGGYNFGTGNAQLDFRDMKFDWAC